MAIEATWSVLVNALFASGISTPADLFTPLVLLTLKQQVKKLRKN